MPTRIRIRDQGPEGGDLNERIKRLNQERREREAEARKEKKVLEEDARRSKAILASQDAAAARITTVAPVRKKVIFSNGYAVEASRKEFFRGEIGGESA